MLYSFIGTDTAGVREKAFHFAESLGDADTELTHVSTENYSNGVLTELAQGVGLFGTIEVVIIDTPSEDESFEEDFFTHLDYLKESSNHFVLIDGKYDAASKKKLTAQSEKVEVVDVGKKEKFNTFSLTDAFLRKDKKSLWLLLNTAWREGISNEEIIGILFWQIKILRLVSKTKSAAESEQKPFVYQKAKRALSNFKEGEVDNLSRSLITIYHDGHLGKLDIDHSLERWVLSI